MTWNFVSAIHAEILNRKVLHHSGAVLAYVLAPHQDEAFVQLKELLEPFGIMQFYTDGWGTYERHLEPSLHTVGKRNTQLYWAQASDLTYPH